VALTAGTYSLAGVTVRALSGSAAVPVGTNLTNFVGTTLAGGTWEAQGRGPLDFGTRSIATLSAGTTVVLDGPNPTSVVLDGLTTNNGTLRVLGGKTFTPTAASVANAGTLEVGAGSTFGKEVVVKNGGTLTGEGAVSGAVAAESGGTVAPGAGTAVLTVNNNLTLQVAPPWRST
jgi:hypothetical protein